MTLEKRTINREIARLTEKIKELLPVVTKTTGYNVHELNAKFGGKHAEYFDIQNQVINSPEEFTALWMKGFLRVLESRGEHKERSMLYELLQFIQNHQEVREYMQVFLERTYLRNYEALSRERPNVSDSEIWIGTNNASYGLLVTPRFKEGQWENDKSEIRHFPKDYWTIGHVLETGLVIPYVDKRILFKDLEQYLTFFQYTIVRASGSIHEQNIAERYCNFVRNSSDPESIPLLIPEFRYAGLEKKHHYRLDLCIIDPFTLSKSGYELSPWSTHGQLRTTGKTQKSINEKAKENFEREMRKQKEYYRTHGVFVLIYTDEDLLNYDKIFEDIKRNLSPKKDPMQLKIHALDELLRYRI